MSKKDDLENTKGITTVPLKSKRPDFQPITKPLEKIKVEKGMSHEDRMDVYRDRVFGLINGKVNQKLFTRFDLMSAEYLGSFPDNTEIAMYSDLIQYIEHSISVDREFFPFSPGTIDSYLEGLVAKSYKRSTIDRRIASLVKWASILEWDDPRSSHKVKARIAKIRKEIKKNSRQAEGLRIEHLKQALETLAPSVARDCQDAAMIWVAFETLCRESEMVSFDWEDLIIDPDGSGTIEITTSKTDQEGEGAIQAISPITVALLMNWKRVCSVDSGPIFRGVYSSAKLGDRMSTRGVDRCYKRVAKRIGLEPSVFSGHSTRVGAAQDMVEAGIDSAKILLAGRWASDAMLVRYAKRIRAKKSGMADYMNQQIMPEIPSIPTLEDD